jgi:hypothetical protein
MHPGSDPADHAEAVRVTSTDNRRRLLIPVLLLIALLGLDVAALILVRRSAPTAGVEETISSTPVVVEPTPAVIDQAQPATISLDWASPPELRWPGAQGLITSVNVAVGETVEHGQIVATVDGVGVIALQSASPFYRSLARGDRGPDVEELSRSLVRLGLLPPDKASSVMTNQVVDAVRALNYRRGVDSTEFSSQHALWLPAPMQIGEVKLQPGVLAASAGETALVGLRGVEGATVRVVTESGAEVELPHDGQSRVVLVDGRELALDDQGRVVGPSVLADSFTADLTKVGGLQVRLQDPRTVYELPASALIVDDQAACVARQDGTMFEVEVVGGRPGVVQLAASPGPSIIANPHDVGLPLTCQPSS